MKADLRSGQKPVGMEPLSKFVGQLRADGVVDSEGSFTVGWAEARRKMQAHQGLAPTRFAVLLVSAGLAWGANSVEIVDQRSDLTFLFSGAYVEESQLMGGFDNLAGGCCSGALLDFMLGLNGAFVLGASEVKVDVNSNLGAYRWTLTPEGESRDEGYGELEAGRMRIRILRHQRSVLSRVQAFLQTMRGRAGMSAECRAVDDLCCRSLVPITISGQVVNRSYQFQPSPILAQVGDRGCAISGDAQVLTFEEQEWSGVLAVASKGRPLELVVRGVTYQGLSLGGLQGILWHDHLRRDISREGVAQDQSYLALERRLREIRSCLLTELAPKLPELSPELAAAVGRELIGALREGALTVEETLNCLRYGLEFLEPLDRLRLYQQAVLSMERAPEECEVWELAREALLEGGSEWEKTDRCRERLRLYADFRTRAAMNADGELLKLVRYEMGRIRAWRSLCPEADEQLRGTLAVDLSVLADQPGRTRSEQEWLEEALKAVAATR